MAEGVVVVHNYYQHAGGEDAVFAGEVAMLRRYGHQVTTYVEHNGRLAEMSPTRAAVNTLWSSFSKHGLQQLLAEANPRIAHFHNTFLAISPSVYYACQEADVPVVQTLHNYRLLCPAATLIREGNVCENCLGKTPPWPGVWHTCYRGSLSQSLVVALMLTLHRWMKTWQEQVDIYIALTEFARRKLIEGGLPADKIAVKPNFVYPDPGSGEGKGSYALFVGRLSPEKGLNTLVQAWRNLKGSALKIVGDGPMSEGLRRVVETQGLNQVELLGRLPRPQVLELMKNSSVLVFPSECYEGFPMTIAEAFACGVPVVASRLGGMAEIVQEGYSGLHFAPRDPVDLAARVDWAWTHPRQMAEMGRNARREYETKYTEEINYERLIQIYLRAMS